MDQAGYWAKQGGLRPGKFLSLFLLLLLLAFFLFSVFCFGIFLIELNLFAGFAFRSFSGFYLGLLLSKYFVLG
jgi:hypothetical protein